MTTVDPIGVASLVATVVLGGVSTYFAWKAWDVSRQGLDLARAQASVAPRLDVSLDIRQPPLTISKRPPAPPKLKVRSSGFLSVPEFDPVPLLKGDVDKADGFVPVKIFNSGGKPANGIQGWLRFSPAFCKPLRGGFVSVEHHEWWYLSKDDPYVVEVFNKKLTPGTSSTFAIPVLALSSGQCAVEYKFVCDEDLTVEGHLIFHVQG